MCRVASLCAVGVVLTFAIGCGGSGSIQGTYVLEEVDGKAVSHPLAVETVKFTSSQMTITRQDGKELTGTYKTDATKEPHEIDMIGSREDGKEEKMYGIYKLEGDKLTMCFSSKPDDRPKEFKTEVGGKATLLLFKKK